jgi:hypothetical protein
MIEKYHRYLEFDYAQFLYLALNSSCRTLLSSKMRESSDWRARMSYKVKVYINYKATVRSLTLDRSYTSVSPPRG